MLGLTSETQSHGRHFQVSIPIMIHELLKGRVVRKIDTSEEKVNIDLCAISSKILWNPTSPVLLEVLLGKQL